MIHSQPTHLSNIKQKTDLIAYSKTPTSGQLIFIGDDCISVYCCIIYNLDQNASSISYNSFPILLIGEGINTETNSYSTLEKLRFRIRMDNEGRRAWC